MSETLIQIPTLETERFIMRAPKQSDFDAYAAFRASDRAKMVGGPNTRFESFNQLAGIVGHWHLRGFGRWIVADKQTDQPLGVVGINEPEGWPEPEIGWSVFESAEGKGVAYEAALTTRRYAYDQLGFTTIMSLIRVDNLRSQALATRIGATYESDFTHAVYGAMGIYRHQGPDA